MFGKGRMSPSSSPGLTLHSTHLARRRSPSGMVRALEKASDGLSSGLHRARQGALRGTARSARCDGRRGGPGRLLADDQGDRQMTTTAMSLSPSLPSSFQLASDEVHSWCASLDVPPETSARLSAILTLDERTRSARFQFERDQPRFIVARAVLRDLLVRRYLQTPPHGTSSDSRMG